jgi:hypothetical protein
LTNDAARSYAQAFDDLVGAPTADDGILPQVLNPPAPDPRIWAPPTGGIRIGLTPAQRRAALLAALVALGCTTLTSDQADVRTQPRDRTKNQRILYFYHGTGTDNARNIIQNGIQPGFTKYKALGDGFYTFKFEDAAEDWALRYPDPAVVKLSMLESIYKDLKKRRLVREAPWLAYPSAPPTPGLDQVLFKPGSFAVLNSAAVTREWKQYQNRSWTPYTTNP